ncbi:MAG: aminopeptidase P family protein [Oscillospiraceae bacterium]|jgi:Xaa-Pro aminopeptidase|nr:aminopeptidase P family protein [Oscillospiraceae bacterium]
MLPLEELAKILPRHAAALITDPVSRRFLTGFPSSDGILFLSREEAVFLTDSRYIEAARAQITVCPVEELSAAPAEQLRKLCGRGHVRRLLLENKRTTLAQAASYRKWLPGVCLEANSSAVDTALTRLRRSKTPAQVDSIRRAQRIAEAALAAVLAEDLHVGMTERALALALDYRMLRGGAEALSFETIAVAGENGSMPHGVPGERALRTGDLVTMDFGAVVEGWHSDMTRTIALGEPGEEQRRVYETVLAAQLAALACVRPGLPCKEADAAARAVITEAGYGEHFRHGTGHGVGLEIHEAPNLSLKSGGALAPGDVVTVEPGVYLPGRCGVRIEDMVLIAEDGYENLTKAAKELLVV